MALHRPPSLIAKLSRSPGKIGMIIFGIVLVIGFAYAGVASVGRSFHDAQRIRSPLYSPRDCACWWRWALSS